MKKSIKTVALFAVLSTMAVSCQKENVADFANGASVSETSVSYTMLYAINGVQHRVTLYGEAEYQAFIHEMMDLARQGYDIVFCDENNQSTNAATKEVLYFSSTNQTEAEDWAAKRVQEGFHVTVTFDENTKTFNCVAWR